MACAFKSTGLIGSNVWEWRLDPARQRGEIYWSFRNVVLQKAIKNSVDATHDEWVDFVQDRVKSLKLGFYGHTTRKYESLEKEFVQGCVPGYRYRGRKRRCWTDNIAEWTRMINEVVTAAEDRDHWRGILCAANPSYGDRHWTKMNHMCRSVTFL